MHGSNEMVPTTIGTRERIADITIGFTAGMFSEIDQRFSLQQRKKKTEGLLHPSHFASDLKIIMALVLSDLNCAFSRRPSLP